MQVISYNLLSLVDEYSDLISLQRLKQNKTKCWLLLFISS